VSTLPTRPGGGLPATPSEPRPDARQRDFLLLTVFVLAQQGYIDRAGVLAEALHMLGDASPETLLARAVLRFFAQDWAAALAVLDELDRLAPIERFGAYRLDDRQRMRRYLKARCLHELEDKGRARDAVEVYLRHGTDPT
jgi:hypothetical protein